MPIRHLITTALLATLSLSAQAQDATLKKIKDSGAITLGHRESSFGFSYNDGSGKPVGYSIDICMRIVEAIQTELGLPKLDIKYQMVTSQNRMPLVGNGTVDIECGSTTNLVERQKQVAFSPDIFRYNVRMLVKADSGIKSIADLQGKSVVTTTGTTSFRLLREADKGRNLDITSMAGKDHSDAFLLLQSGRAQAFVLDDILLAGLVATSKKPADFVLTGESLRTENQALMFRKDEPDMRRIVDTVVTGMMQSGEMAKLYDKWFTSPIPPRGVNINYPLNAETQEAFAHPSAKGI